MLESYKRFVLSRFTHRIRHSKVEIFQLKRLTIPFTITFILFALYFVTNTFFYNSIPYKIGNYFLYAFTLSFLYSIYHILYFSYRNIKKYESKIKGIYTSVALGTIITLMVINPILDFKFINYFTLLLLTILSIPAILNTFKLAKLSNVSILSLSVTLGPTILYISSIPGDMLLNRMYNDYYLLLTKTRVFTAVLYSLIPISTLLFISFLIYSLYTLLKNNKNQRNHIKRETEGEKNHIIIEGNRLSKMRKKESRNLTLYGTYLCLSFTLFFFSLYVLKSRENLINNFAIEYDFHSEYSCIFPELDNQRKVIAAIRLPNDRKAYVAIQKSDTRYQYAELECNHDKFVLRQLSNLKI